MELFDCSVGQRVFHKETGKPATIKQLWRAKGEVEIALDNGLAVRVNPKTLEPSGSAVEPRATKRPCPQCGADLGEAETCSQCNFAYRLTQKRGMPVAYSLLIAVILIAVVGFVVWKFVLHERLP